MTMIAGFALPDSVLIAADCRVTWVRAAAPFSSDSALKLLKLTDAILMGYAGDVHTVQYLFPHIMQQMERRRRDPDSVSRWLPRFLRATYRALARQYPIGPVELLVASTLKGRPCRVERGLIFTTMHGMAMFGQRNVLAERCAELLTGSPTEKIAVPDSSEALLYAMRAPDFEPVFCPPLSFNVIGTGRPAMDHIDRYAHFIACGPPEKAADRFLDALSSYLGETSDPTVGGMFLVAEAVNGGTRVRPYRLSAPNGDVIEIVPDGYSFALRNTATKQCVRLLYPLELLSARPRAPVIFEGFRQALEANRHSVKVLNDEIDLRLETFYKSLQK